jgi:pimeloyl-ACP methyl ester carboxylesterase
VCFVSGLFLTLAGGSRLDGLDALELLLPYNITVVTMDFTGSGISEGDYVSLGYYEKEDLRVVVDHLRASGNVTRIGLWGRSMGAATAVLYAHTDPSIAGMVLDSGFASLSLLARELAEQSEFKVPKMVVSIAMKMIRKSIKSKAGFDIKYASIIVSALASSQL